MSAIGTSTLRKEGPAKLTGAAIYVDDLTLPEQLYGATLRSPCARGVLRGVTFGPDVPWHEFTIVTAADLPGDNVIALINDDQPCLVRDRINHPEEPVVLLAHPDRFALNRARQAVQLHIDPLPPVLSIEESLRGAEVIWGADNVFKRYAIDKGDVDAAFRRDDVVVFEGTYTTGAQEQLYLEPNGVVAQYSAAHGVTVWGSLQCPYYVQKALCRLLGLGPERVRVIQMETGGGFGGKEDYPSMIAAHAALLSRKAGRPVKIIYDRGEDMAATTKRHPSRTRHRTAVQRDGTLLAMDIDFAIDGGAYSTLSQVVLSRGAIHAAGPYRCPNLRVRAAAVATNTPPHGAFRGFGAPQSIFALERHLDEIARGLGLAPEELRRRNFVRPGDTLATSQRVRDQIDLGQLLDRALEESGYHRRKQELAGQRPDATVRRGVGLACFLHGTGFTGSGEAYLASLVAVEARPEDVGRVRVLSSSTEIGQGTTTIFAQIAAAALQIDPGGVWVPAPDTAAVPDSGPTVASRTCAIVGKLVETAALSLRQTLLDSGLLAAPYDDASFREAVRCYTATFGVLRAFAQHRQPAFIQWDEARFQGDAYGSFSWAVYVAQVRVDLLTYEARVEDFYALQEVGRVINPTLAAGQIEGGVAQGIGFALYENVAWKDGRMANARMTDYIIPTAADIPPITVRFEERPYPHGAFGAKGIGELPMDGPAPAIINAIHDALGVSLRSVPATPEAIFAALEVSDAA